MSAETKFTPGPWSWSPDMRSLEGGNNRATVAFIYEGRIDAFESDKALIAAAPDLYAALDAMLAANSGDLGDSFQAACERAHAAADLARAALAKARGE